ncbi:DUF3465 domain-containing protein [uncultured Paraglaciecola sp.]|uniref:DUF3465 domain-containing protein n=1 Tax=uncultured Paraglaciecola sp. TaxID=1765024 RepID=UPI0030D8CD37|tara:strand:- start:20518 stop:20976 length:459 start_codon:yes stop_codon:yes gene_type:complete
MKKILVILLILAAFYYWSSGETNTAAIVEKPTQDLAYSKTNRINDEIELAYKNRQSNVQVSGTGTVIKLLRDDNEGARHQKFILRLSSGQTLLIAHNIDLAPRVNSISNGDQVQFYGEYEWNNKGGVVHWTHHAPNGHHYGGWLKHKGKTYQ